MATSQITSIVKSALELQVLELVESVAAPLGFRPVEVDCRVGGTSLVRVFVERLPRGPETAPTDGMPVAPSSLAPTLDECAEVSRAVEAALDLKTGEDAEEKWFSGAYTLEMSSPGLDRRLRIQPDFERAVGKSIRLKLTEKLLGTGINVVGMLTRIDGDTLHMRVPGAKPEELVVRLGQIRTANVVWRREE